MVRPQGSKPGILETLVFDPKPSTVGLLSVLGSPTGLTVYEVYGIGIRVCRVSSIRF